LATQILFIKLVLMTSNASEGRLEDIQVWEMEKIKESKKGSKKYTHWIGLLTGGCQGPKCAPRELKGSCPERMPSRSPES
jgi:hypothetical protein